MQERHRQLFFQFSDTFSSETRDSWQESINAWKSDHAQPNPYMDPGPSKSTIFARTVESDLIAHVESTMQEVRLELAKDDATSAAQGGIFIHKSSLTGFITRGIELEEQQYVCRNLYLAFSNINLRRSLAYEITVMKKYETQKQLADLEEKRHTLLYRITQWREVQLAYIPAAGPLVAMTASEVLSHSDGENSVLAENLPLFLPSSLPLDIRTTRSCTQSMSHEARLREAQADDTLADIRHSLRIIAGLWQFKRQNVSGTGNHPNTRMHVLYTRFKHRIGQSILRYRAARTALVVLDPNGEWKERLQELNDGDVHGPGNDDDGFLELSKGRSGSGKGRYEMSWIWLRQRIATEAERSGSNEVLDVGMRVEWAKSQARADRWDEEVHIVLEEMR